MGEAVESIARIFQRDGRWRHVPARQFAMVSTRAKKFFASTRKKYYFDSFMSK
ncbi:MAG: hypothetical protein LBI48_05905 [Burkholderiaceae bacterium]|jgi:hypothetical protein|nr:hypothetical protein [Burkholderiaceae bacterium]